MFKHRVIMKKIILASLFLTTFHVAAQDHFSGINTSRRVGIQNISINPAELANLRSKYETTLFSVNVGVQNNKVGFGDLSGDADFEDLIFDGKTPVNLRFDAEITGPSFAFRYEKWGFAITTKAFAKMNLVDVDVNIGQAISNNDLLFGSTTLANNYNQRMNGTTWGEVGFSAARNFYDSEKHRFSGGATIKLLFPGSYANFGADKFHGVVTNDIGTSYLSDANANLNITYSGNLADDFTNFGDYSNSLFGKLNGVAVDLGANYQMKGSESTKNLLNAGISVRNIGAMTFKDNNNSSTNYQLTIPVATLANPGLNLSQFDDTESLQDVENTLLSSGYLDKTTNKQTDFKVKLPTILTLYADVKVVSSFYVTLFTNQKLNKDSGNDQITSQNVFSAIPRMSWNHFEVWSNLSSNEISGFAAGLGFRAYGFFIGSSSAFTALANDAKKGDIYLGYSFGLK